MTTSLRLAVTNASLASSWLRRARCRVIWSAAFGAASAWILATVAPAVSICWARATSWAGVSSPKRPMQFRYWASESEGIPLVADPLSRRRCRMPLRLRSRKAASPPSGAG